jgi:hypothetical protein
MTDGLSFYLPPRAPMSLAEIRAWQAANVPAPGPGELAAGEFPCADCGRMRFRGTRCPWCKETRTARQRRGEARRGPRGWVQPGTDAHPWAG